jgi:hypothetical protein
LVALVALSTLAVSTAAEPPDPFESEAVTETIEAVAEAAQDEAVPATAAHSDR